MGYLKVTGPCLLETDVRCHHCVHKPVCISQDEKELHFGNNDIQSCVMIYKNPYLKYLKIRR